MPCKVLILTQYFPPETGAPQARLSEMALWLTGTGFEVEVLTAMPNYPAGKVFPGYGGKMSVRESWNGVSVIRSAIFPSKSPKPVPRLLSYFSFVFSSFLIGLFRIKRPDVILVESPPLFLGLSAVMLKWSKRCRLVFNVSDLWPETAVALGLYDRESMFVRIAEKLERFLYKTSDVCTGQSFGIVGAIIAKAPNKRVTLIPNGADCVKFSPDHRNTALFSAYAAANKTVIGYVGLIGVAQGVSFILDTARRCLNNPNLVFLIVGDGAEREELEKRAKSDGLENVVFTGLLPKEDMPALVASLDITLIPLKSFIPGALPSKMYEAMASAVPIILAAEGDPKELLERSGAGIYVPYNDIDETVRAIDLLASSAAERMRYGMQGRAYVLAYHQRHAIAEKLGYVLDSVAHQQPQLFPKE